MGGDYFSGISVGIFVWLVGFGGNFMEFSQTVSAIFVHLRFVGVGIFAMFLFLFAIRYSVGVSVSKWHFGLLTVVPSITVVVLLLNPFFGLFWSDMIAVEQFGLRFFHVEFGPFLLFLIVYSYILVSISSALLLQVAFSDPREFLFQSGLIVVGVVSPFVVSFLYLEDLLPVVLFNPTPFLVTISQCLFFVLIYYTDFYTLKPGLQSVGWNLILNQIDTGVCMTDIDGQIVEYNQQFLNMFSIDDSEAAGSHITELVDVVLDPPYEETTQYNENYYKTVVDSVTIDSGTLGGYVVTVEDVTDSVRKRQQIQILNRFMRHNLRNSLSIISLSSERFTELNSEDSADEEIISRNTNVISNQINKLMSVSKAAKDVESIIGDQSSLEVKSVAEIIDTGFSSFFEDINNPDDFSVTVDIEMNRCVSVTPNYYVVIQQLIRNSVEHNKDVEDLVISISAEESSYCDIAICIRDNGSGVPESEVNMFTSELESNEIDQICHGTGVGFGVAYSLTMQSNGVFEIDSDVSEGSLIKLHLQTTPITQE
jgi:signal transduction histidine kinase